MTVIIQEVYKAFKETGASEETAQNAAKALTSYGDKFHQIEREIDNRFNKLEREMDKRFNELEKKIDTNDTETKGKLRLHNWMLSFQLALIIAILFLLLRISL
jgi:hemerythrin-like domain-containing protein